MSKSSAPNADPVIAALHKTANRAADASDTLINRYFRSTMAVDNKLAGSSGSEGANMYDPVTEADRGAEQEIRAIISADFPGHGITGEEFGTTSGTSPYEWIIDPIDGTRAFVAGFPTFGTLIGVYREEVPTFGLMSQPFTRERYWGHPDASHYAGPEGTRQLKTRSCAGLSDAVLTTTTLEMFPDPGDMARFVACRDKARIVRYGGDCYAYCLLAAGHVDIIIEASLEPYDIAALISIIEGAGGQVTNWQGGSAARGGQVVATSDIRLHEEALTILGPGD